MNPRRQDSRERGRQAARPRRRGLLALGLAWLLLLLTLGGAVGYAFLTYQAPLPQPEVTPPPRFEEAPVPAPTLPEGPGSATSAPAAEAPAETSPRDEPPPAAPPADETAPGTAPADPPAAAPAGGAPNEAGQAAPAPAAEAPGEATTGESAAGEATTGEPAAGEPERPAGAEAGPQQAALPAAPPVAPVEPAWQRFAMPYAGAGNLPRIAVVVTGLGLHDGLTQRAIEELPPGITLSFSPYARGVETWLAQARAKGHEVMLDLPMEPKSFPNSDPGHFALFVSNSPEENLEQLREVLGRGSAYVGVAGVMGSRFTEEPEALRPVLRALGDRGLIFLDNRASDAGVAARLGRELGVPTLYSDRTLDGEFVQANAIDSRLAQVERLARTKGVAVAMANVYPTTFRQLEAWADELQEKGLALAPVSAVLGRQPPPE